ncbi:MAG: hypothetical protein QOD06_365 [Candidatus Binatota bacterium]|nr:hypothetical protein [Candidatus Binatota bacterium]
MARTLLAALLTFAVALPACTREEGHEEQSSRRIVEAKRLPTPRSGVTLADVESTKAMPAHTPGDEPPPTGAAIGPVTGAAPEPPTMAPPAMAASPAAPKAAAPEVAAAPTAMPKTSAPPPPPPAAPFEPRPGVVFAGVDLLTGPSADARVRGTFEGRTDIEVVAEQNGYARVRAPVIDGGFVEGWVPLSSLGEPQMAKASRMAAPAGKAPSGKPPAGKAPAAKLPAGKAAPPAKGVAPAAPAAPKAAARAAGDKGPKDILLQPIAGTEKKRPATPFTHKAHYDDYSVKCETCHHPVKARGGKVDDHTCSSAGCHAATQCDNKVVPKKNKACPFFEDAYHINCIECHKKDGGPTKCAECHTG